METSCSTGIWRSAAANPQTTFGQGSLPSLSQIHTIQVWSPPGTTDPVSRLNEWGKRIVDPELCTSQHDAEPRTCRFAAWLLTTTSQVARTRPTTSRRRDSASLRCAHERTTARDDASQARARQDPTVTCRAAACRLIRSSAAARAEHTELVALSNAWNVTLHSSGGAPRRHGRVTNSAG